MTATEILRPKSPEETGQLMKVALGEENADLVILNANLVNVYTGEILKDRSVSVKGEWIAYAGKKAADSIGPQTEVIDARGQTVIPGLIEGHTHLAWLYSAYEFLRHVIAGGTTTIVTETFEVYPVSGYEGVVDFLESLTDQPIKIFGTVPAMISISEAARGIPPETLEKLLARDDVLGMGESYWQAVLQEPDRILPLFEQTLAANKTLEGHSAGASDKKLSAYVGCGISSCHEPIDADQVLERLRLGLHIMIREGSIRRDLENIAQIKESGIDLRRLILSTDGVEPEDLLEKGFMEFVLQKAINCGFDPVTAIQMATLNVAEHFSLDAFIGGIAPGRQADMVIIPDVHTISARLVISKGRVIAREGKILVSPRKHEYTNISLNSVQLSRDMQTADFSIRVKEDTPMIGVRVIDLVTDLVTAEIEIQWPVIEGQLHPDVHKDVAKVSAIDRTHHPGKTFSGLIRGFGLQSGAMACSAAWDSTDIIVVGANDADMACAANRIHALQGGAVVCDKGRIISELPLSVFGIISELSLEDIVDRLKKIKKAAADLGVPHPDPLLTLITLTGAAIPYLRICEEGLVNLKDGKTRSLFVN
ncbi:MAG: adenine deaminase C-terminal domain-containing protein [Desulfobacterales bacterium]|jgi:adenine deaminase